MGPVKFTCKGLAVEVTEMAVKFLNRSPRSGSAIAVVETKCLGCDSSWMVFNVDCGIFTRNDNVVWMGIKVFPSREDQWAAEDVYRELKREKLRDWMKSEMDFELEPFEPSNEVVRLTSALT